MPGTTAPEDRDVTVEAGDVQLPGMLHLPSGATGIVVFAHGSGSSRFSRRNQRVAEFFNRGGLATLLFDLLTAEENRIDEQTRHLRFDIPMLGERLIRTLDWIRGQPNTASLRIGLFGASAGAAATLIAAAERPEAVRAVVSRGGRPDLAGACLERVRAPVLLIIGAEDYAVIGMNRKAAAALDCPHRIEIVAGATHLFEEPGRLEEVARLARDWLLIYL